MPVAHCTAMPILHYILQVVYPLLVISIFWVFGVSGQPTFNRLPKENRLVFLENSKRRWKKGTSILLDECHFVLLKNCHRLGDR